MDGRQRKGQARDHQPGQITVGVSCKESEAALVLRSASSAGNFRVRFVCTASFSKFDNTNKSVVEDGKVVRDEVIQKVKAQDHRRGDGCIGVEEGNTILAIGG